MRIYTSLFFLVSIFSILSFASCEVINPAEEIPSYIRIDSISFIDSIGNNQPAPRNSQKITDAWVLIDGKLQGVYELPAVFPILKEGPISIEIYGGIMENGISNTRAPYPFFTSYKTSANVSRQFVDTIKPVMFYDPVVTHVSMLEDFEDPGTLLTFSDESTVDTLEKVDEDSLVLRGNFSGLYVLNSTHAFLDAKSSNEYVLPGNGASVYVELNYKSDVELMFGLITNNQLTGQIDDEPKINLYPSAQWKKVYINISPEVSSNPASKFRIYFRANHNSANTQSHVYLDDIKLIHK